MYPGFPGHVLVLAQIMPCDNRAAQSDGIAVRIAQHLAPSDVIGPPDDPILLHPLDQAGGRIVADAQLALEP